VPLQKLSRNQVSANSEYVEFLQGLRVGEGGQSTVAREGVGKVSIKQRLDRAAEVVGVKIRYLRTNNETVVFQVTGRK